MVEIVFRVPLLVRLTRCRKSRETQQRFQRAIERNHKMTATLLLVTPKVEKQNCKLDGGYLYIKLFIICDKSLWKIFMLGRFSAKIDNYLKTDQ